MDRQQQLGGHHIVHNGVEIIAGQIVPAPSVRPGRSAADEAAEGKAGHNKGLRQFSRQASTIRSQAAARARARPRAPAPCANAPPFALRFARCAVSSADLAPLAPLARLPRRCG